MSSEKEEPEEEEGEEDIGNNMIDCASILQISQVSSRVVQREGPS